MMTTQCVRQQPQTNAAIVPALHHLGSLHGVTCLTRPEPNQYIPAGAVYEAVALNRVMEWLGCRRTWGRDDDVVTWANRITKNKPTRSWKVNEIIVFPDFVYYAATRKKPRAKNPIHSRLAIWDYIHHIAAKLPAPPQMDRHTWRRQYRMLRIVARLSARPPLSIIAHLIRPIINDSWIPAWRKWLGHGAAVDLIIIPGQLPPVLMLPPKAQCTYFIYVGDLTACHLLGLHYDELAAQAAIESMA